MGRGRVGEEGVSVCVLANVTFFFLYDFTTLLKCTTTTSRAGRGVGVWEERGRVKKNNANKQKVAKVHNGKIETEIMKIA